jgi:hypothetical protein
LVIKALAAGDVGEPLFVKERDPGGLKVARYGGKEQLDELDK